MASIGQPGKGKQQTGAGRHTPKPMKGERGEKKRKAIEAEKEMTTYTYTPPTLSETAQFIVRCDWLDNETSLYGPFESKEEAAKFADYWQELNDDDVAETYVQWLNVVEG